LKNDLFEIGLKTETDKASHFYLHHYDRILSKFRDKNIKLLEIGVWKGQSIQMWREYFPNAEIHCVDINFIDLQIPGVVFHRVDCDNLSSLADLAKELGNLDVVIDDGGHTMRQQQFAFKCLWKSVNQDGIFIMEDMHTSLKNLYPRASDGVSEKSTTLEMFECLRKNREFSSPFISSEEFKSYQSTADKVEIIWSKQIQTNYSQDNASITGFVTKKVIS
jgi:hypothetical protein